MNFVTESRGSAACSIALCTYNGETFLREQLDSFVAQTVLPAELVVVDDLSSDSTVRIAEEFSTHAPFPVRIVQNEERLGPGANFFKALALCSSPIVFFSDQDDVWKPEKIQRTIQAFVDDSVMSVASNATVVGTSLTSQGRTLWQAMGFELNAAQSTDTNVFEHLLRRGNFVAGMTMAVRREFSLAQTPLPSPWLHDGWLAITAAAVGGLRLVHEELSLYRQHEKNVIGVPRLSILQVKKLLGLTTKRIDLNDAYDQAEVALQRLSPFLSATQRSFLEGRRSHLQVRLSLPAFRPARLPRIFAQVFGGEYNKYSAGLLGAARDLLRAIPRT